jgi:hypothetical protein
MFISFHYVILAPRLYCLETIRYVDVIILKTACFILIPLTD